MNYCFLTVFGLEKTFFIMFHYTTDNFLSVEAILFIFTSGISTEFIVWPSIMI